jgi:hypothetical protein
MPTLLSSKSVEGAYPLSRASQSLPFARNAGVGPANNTAVTGADQAIVWSPIQSGVPDSSTIALPAQVSGDFLVSGVVSVTNGTGAAVLVTAQVGLNAVPQDPVAGVTVGAGGAGRDPVLGGVRRAPGRRGRGLPGARERHRRHAVRSQQLRIHPGVGRYRPGLRWAG